MKSATFIGDSVHVCIKASAPMFLMAEQSNSGKCSYQFADESYCQEPIFSDAKCILHVGLPVDKSSVEFKNVNALKEKRVKQKAADNEWNFEGAHLSAIDFHESTINGDLNARNGVIEGKASFDGATIEGKVSFDGATIKGDASFEGATIKGKASFDGATIEGGAFFIDATIKGDVWFAATIEGDVWFNTATIKGDAYFNTATIKGEASFFDATIKKNVAFTDAMIKGEAQFSKATIGELALFTRATLEGDAFFDLVAIEKGVWFSEATIKKNISFYAAKINGDVIFEHARINGDVGFYGTVIGGDALFQGASIGGDSSFHLAGIKGTLSFRDAKFSKPEAQAEACAKATQLCQKAGYTREVDYHYYRQMAGERRLKPWYRRYSELPVQYVIGYGVYPFRLVWWFFIFVVLFGLLFSLEAGEWTLSTLVSNLRESFLTIFNPISGIQNAGSGVHGTIAMVAAFIGIVMWPVFVASLARKYGK
jgi:uncharacterized protein YjbI with pentapeptide repeats